MKKRILSLVLVVAVAVMSMAVLSGCGENANTSAKFKVGICQLVQHDALDAATKGFRDALTELLGEDVVFDEQNAQNDSTTCATICNQFVSSGYDLILANATPALQAATAATSTIPILGTSITDYATALSISDWKGTTGKNVSGTSDLAPLDKQADIFSELLPNAKTVGILFCSAEPNSYYQASVMEEALTKKGITTKEYTFTDSNDIASVTTAACSECDALYVPTDNTAASNAELINSIAVDAKVPIVAGEENICKGCGIATLSISYYDIGYEAGKMAYEILVNNADISNMEVKYAPNVTKKYNAKIANELGIKVDDSYTAIEE